VAELAVVLGAAVSAAETGHWADPGATEVAPGIWRIPLPLPNDGLRAVNAYAIADGEHVVLIDSGWALAESEALLVAALDGIGYGLAQVSQFLVTHQHRDHYTQAVAVRRAFGTPIAVGLGERPALEWLALEQSRRPVRQAADLLACGAAEVAAELRGMPVAELVERIWELPDRWLAADVEVTLSTRTLRAIATPGHTSGHLVFHDPTARILFAGDHVLPHITPSIGFEPFPGTSPLSDYLGSLALVRGMPDARLLPAHGPVGASVHARVDELLEHHRVRLDDTHAAVTAGARTAFEVAQRLTWTRRERKLADLDVFNRMLAILETQAHLRVLAEHGTVTVIEVDGVWHYA
jgi:glyoxylase-like metal-dependent hydrolase (beta-lactamase superfamily II)